MSMNTNVKAEYANFNENTNNPRDAVSSLSTNMGKILISQQAIINRPDIHQSASNSNIKPCSNKDDSFLISCNLSETSSQTPPPPPPPPPLPHPSSSSSTSCVKKDNAISRLDPSCVVWMKKDL